MANVARDGATNRKSWSFKQLVTKLKKTKIEDREVDNNDGHANHQSYEEANYHHYEEPNDDFDELDDLLVIGIDFGTT